MLALFRGLPQGELSLKTCEAVLGGMLDGRSSTYEELRNPKFEEERPGISHLDSVGARMWRHAVGGSRSVRDELSSLG